MLSGPSKATVIVSCVFPPLAALAVALRFYARRLKSLAFQADDYVTLLALVITVASCVPYIVGATIGGIGFHIQDLTEDEFTLFGKILFALQFTYLAAVTLVKLSILLFYKRIFPTEKFRTAIHVMSTLVVAWSITFFFATLFQAMPISSNWDPNQPGKMINEFVMYTAAASIEMVLDVAMLVMPWPMIWSLHMSTNRKWIVSGIFLLGGFVCITSIFRLYYLIQYLNPTAQQSEDFTYDLANLIIWSAIEPCAGIICACLPVLGPIYRGCSAESLVGSIKGYLSFGSLRSRGSRSSLESGKEKLPKSSEDSNTTPKISSPYSVASFGGIRQGRANSFSNG